MKDFKTFEEAFIFQTHEKGVRMNGNGIRTVKTGVDVLDLIQFSIGEIVWICIANTEGLDQCYEEWVTQYGVTADGRWAAVEGYHCSCYEWEEMCENDVTYYDSLETLLKADPNSSVVVEYKDNLLDVYAFLRIQ